ncbi:MAG: hypothetical protein ACP5NF_01515 [Thermoanaerobaculum sp.]
MNELGVQLPRLSENHRRVVVTLLEVFLRDLRELSPAGVVAATPSDLQNLEALWVSLRGGVRTRNLEAVKALLGVELGELETGRLGGYGPLLPEQQESLGRLGSVLRQLLADPAGPRAVDPA